MPPSCLSCLQQLVPAPIRCKQHLFASWFTRRSIHEAAPRSFQPQNQQSVQVATLSLWLKATGRQWYDKLFQFLLSHDYTSSPSYHSLFIKHVESHTTTILVYVDDIILTRTNNEEIQHITHLLHTNFCIKNLGDLTYFLGLEVARNPSSIHLSQCKYTLDLLTETGVLDFVPVPTPILERGSYFNLYEDGFDDAYQFRISLIFVRLCIRVLEWKYHM